MPVETSSYFKLVCKEIVERLQKGEELSRLKTEIARKYRLERLPTNAELLAATTEEERRNLLPLLQLKPVRSLSGVNVIAVMTPPSPCPHGKVSSTYLCRMIHRRARHHVKHPVYKLCCR